jgi:hypothetical protein
MTTSTLTSIAELFTKHVPCKDSAIADDMERGLQAYREAFIKCRDSVMRYQSQPEYQNSTYIMQIPQDQHWVYTPHFRKFVGLAIEKLFNSKITAMGMSIVAMEQNLVYVDEDKNRWILCVVEEEGETSQKIYMYFPRFDTITACLLKKTNIEHLIDPEMSYYKENKLGVSLEDTSSWHEKASDK